MEISGFSSDEDSVLFINDLKIKWFTLLSRVDASPTIDETVLTSLNSIANLLISTRSTRPGCDFLFEAALRLGVFETIFKWNFVFCGADLEAFKAKVLQFYDTLITGDGKQYLRHPEFAIPLLATLHHCAIRSSLPVERVLVRTLNSVCAAMCSQFSESIMMPGTNFIDRENHVGESGFELTEDLSLFRRLSMGLVSDCRHQMESKWIDSEFLGPNSELGGSMIKMADAVDWPLTIDPRAPGSTDASSKPLERSISYTSHDSLYNIDSIFDLLIPFVFREGDLGWQARDAFLLVATYSNKDEEFSYSLAQNSSVCPVLATGLSTLYAELPRELITNNYPQSWPELVQSLEEQEQKCPEFVEFFGALEFCESILEVAHPLIQSSLLQFIHSGFFVSVLGFALTKADVLEVITATVLLKEILLRTTNSAILPALLRFLLTTIPEEKQNTEEDGVSKEFDVKSESDPERQSTLSDLSRDPIEYNSTTIPIHGLPNRTYMDLLISRLHYCNTLLGVATLSLFNTILNLNCEDVMFYLVLRHLVPFRDALFALGWSWPEPNTFVRASDDFLDLITSYQDDTSSKHYRWMASVSSDASSITGSVAELNLDEDVETTAVTDADVKMKKTLDLSESPSVDLVRRRVDPITGLPEQSGCTVLGEPGSTEPIFGEAPMNALMPVHSESLSSPVMNGINQVIDSNETGMDQFKHLFRRRKSQSEKSQCLTGITPDDWLKYTNWARESIHQRIEACTRWRLVFDAIYPSASQVAQFELSWNKVKSESYLEDTIEEPISRNHRASSSVEWNSNIALSHEHFKCFVSDKLTAVNAREIEGERTAKALRSAVNKLDIDAELDLDELEEQTEENQDLCQPAYPVISDVGKNVTNLASGDSALHSSCTPGTPSAYTGVVISNDRYCNENGEFQNGNHSISSFSDNADSTDSGCLVTEGKSVQEANSALSSIPIIGNERNLSDMKSINSNLANSSAVKSWYCLNYLESDSSDPFPDADPSHTVQPNVSEVEDELHEVDLSQQYTAPTPKCLNGDLKRPADSTRLEVQAVLDASKADDLEQFVQCLEEVDWAPPNTLPDNHKGPSSDLRSYTDYLDRVLIQKRKQAHAFEDCMKSCPNDTTKQRPQHRDAIGAASNGCSFSTTANDSSNLMEEMCGKKSYRESTSNACKSHGTPTNHSTSREDIEAYVTKPDRSKFKLIRNLSHQPGLVESVGTSSTQYLGALTKRHSVQEVNGIQSTVTKGNSEPVIGSKSRSNNLTAIPNLGPFMTTIIARLESLPHNCFYANLYLTSILSSLASYSQPLLRAIMLLVPPILPSNKSESHQTKTDSEKVEDMWTWRTLDQAYSPLPYTVLCSVRRQLDLFSVQYTMCPPEGMTMSFMGLVQDAKQYFRHANEPPRPLTLNNNLTNGTQNANGTTKKPWIRRVSFLRRLFNRSKKNVTDTMRNQPRPGPMCLQECTPDRVSVTLSPHAYPQPGRPSVTSRQVSHYAWLPEVGLPSHSSLMKPIDENGKKSKSKRKGKRQPQQPTSSTTQHQQNRSKRRRSTILRRSSSVKSESESQNTIDWPAVQRMVLCAMVFEEFCKEMAALCIEHSVRS